MVRAFFFALAGRTVEGKVPVPAREPRVVRDPEGAVLEVDGGRVVGSEVEVIMRTWKAL
jgi:hypothetical protein